MTTSDYPYRRRRFYAESGENEKRLLRRARLETGKNKCFMHETTRNDLMKYISLTENHLFSKAYKNGRRIVCRTMAVYVMKDLHEKRLKKANPLKESINRVGISASKKIGGAVERNRAKRIIREAYRQIDSLYGIRCGMIIVIAARETATEVKMQDAMRDLQYALTKLDMLERPPEEDKDKVPDGQSSTDEENI